MAAVSKDKGEKMEVLMKDYSLFSFSLLSNVGGRVVGAAFVVVAVVVLSLFATALDEEDDAQDYNGGEEGEANSDAEE